MHDLRPTHAVLFKHFLWPPNFTHNRNWMKECGSAHTIYLDWNKTVLNTHSLLSVCLGQQHPFLWKNAHLQCGTTCTSPFGALAPMQSQGSELAHISCNLQTQFSETIQKSRFFESSFWQLWYETIQVISWFWAHESEFIPNIWNLSQVDSSNHLVLLVT